MEFTSEVLADYALELSSTSLSNDAIEMAKRLVLDSLGCCLGAYSSPPSKHLRSIYGNIGGKTGGTATVFGSGTSTLVEYAGFINSAMVRYLDYNDAYISEGRACHPSDHIPALISIAESEGCTGSELLEAIVLAYEIEGLGLDTGVTWEHGYDYVTWGSYSSVVSVGKLMDLSREQFMNALGIAGSSNLTLSISRRGDVSMWKGIAHPYVTHNAIQACQMAKSGVTGPDRVLDGPGGFWEVAARSDLDIDRLGGRDGADYRVTKANIKPYPCGYYMMPMISGILDLVESNEVDPDTIEEVRIETFANAVEVLAGEEKWSKELTRESADHSIPYTTAIAILYGNVLPEHFDEAYRSNRTVHRLMDRVVVAESGDLNDFAVNNPSATPSIVRLVTGDGELQTRIDYAPGHAKNPLSDEEIVRKVKNMADPLLTADQVERLVRSCHDLDELPTVDAIIADMSI